MKVPETQQYCTTAWEAGWGEGGEVELEYGQGKKEMEDLTSIFPLTLSPWQRISFPNSSFKLRYEWKRLPCHLKIAVARKKSPEVKP